MKPIEGSLFLLTRNSNYHAKASSLAKTYGQFEKVVASYSQERASRAEIEKIDDQIQSAKFPSIASGRARK